jgi:hypothetical protein
MCTRELRRGLVECSVHQRAILRGRPSRAEPQQWPTGIAMAGWAGEGVGLCQRPVLSPDPNPALPGTFPLSRTGYRPVPAGDGHSRESSEHADVRGRARRDHYRAQIDDRRHDRWRLAASVLQAD